MKRRPIPQFASTGPRSIERGGRDKVSGKPQAMPSFNGAALNRARRVSALKQTYAATPRFKGAALIRAGRADHTLNPVWGCTASTGPRSIERGGVDG